MLTKCYFSIGTYRDRYGARTMELADRVEQRLKLHDLRVLMTVVQVGSMGKAARELGTSQPAISRAITDLKQMLGVPLLDRNSHGIKTTKNNKHKNKHNKTNKNKQHQTNSDIAY